MRNWKSAAGLLLLLGAALARASCPAEQARTVQIGAQRFAVEVAATPTSRERGLSGHEGLAPDSGMWFVLPEAGKIGFWMRGMRFPIDLIWVGPKQRVVGVATLPVCRDAPCPITYPAAPAAYVLEIGAGRFAGRTGDKVEWNCHP
ncbi:MAG: DUF192 domain-containing protein [Gallionellaceae bacterium]|nr:DUF192 domain-containing protein [Gallionellaceae bacterium]